MKLSFVLLMKSHLQSYRLSFQINSFWNLGFNLLGITIILQIITGIFLAFTWEHQILIQHILVFSFLLEKSSMDGVYVIFNSKLLASFAFFWAISTS